MPFSFDPPPDENEIECARCGTYFHYELTRCPECGVNIYEPDDEIDIEYLENTSDRSTPLDNLFNRIRKIFGRFTGKPYSAEEVFGDSLDQAVLYDDLLSKVGGDHLVVERLIEFEQKQKPNSNRKTWLENAIERWEHDNRIQGSS
ncbi:hypothetical protein ACFLXI_03985 [Chloroflexota bacterium]